jgi:hypothetical protein
LFQVSDRLQLPSLATAPLMTGTLAAGRYVVPVGSGKARSWEEGGEGTAGERARVTDAGAGS